METSPLGRRRRRRGRGRGRVSRNCIVSCLSAAVSAHACSCFHCLTARAPLVKLLMLG